ncbi:hypothetical protein Tco_0734876 [Tanacetum coccineum]
MGRLSLSNQEQSVKEEQRHVLSKIHQSYYQPLHVTRSINSKKKQGGLAHGYNDHIYHNEIHPPSHETDSKVRAILPDTLTNQAIKDSEAYKTYHDFATRKVVPKPKENTDQDPKASPGKRLKATAKVATSRKKKLPAQGLETLSEIAFGSGADEGTGVSPRVPDVPTYGSEDEQISWKSSDDDGDDDNVSESKDDDDNVDNEDDDGQDDDNEQTESDNDGEDFVHPKFSTHDETKKQGRRNKEEERRRAGSNRGSKRRRARKEPESTSAPKEKTSKSSDNSKERSKSYHTSTGKSAQAEEPIHADEDLEEPHIMRGGKFDT